MKKLLAAGAVALIALLVLIWYQLNAPDAVAAAGKQAAPKADVAAAPAAQSPLANVENQVAKAKNQEGKLDKSSDEFFYRLDEALPQNLTMQAATCYTGGLHRVGMNAMLKLNYNVNVLDGEVTIRDVKVAATTINDAPLVKCMVDKVAAVHWHDDALPDHQEPDELVISPERGMKKYMKDNMDYDGDGPTVQAKDMPKWVKTSRGQD
jgi:hypothetical protein